MQGIHKKINGKLRRLEVDLQNKTDTIEKQKLQRRIESIEKSISKLGDEDKEETTDYCNWH